MQINRRHLLVLALVAGCRAEATPGPRIAPMPEIRDSVEGLRTPPTDDNQIGSSGVSGVHTKVLYGDPSKSGLYSILLYVPPHTSIAAHSHADSRMATVVSGTWHFGYGDRLDGAKLVDLPPGSVYSEPGRDDHFAQTGDDAVVVHIVGYGPTDTIYVNPTDAP